VGATTNKNKKGATAPIAGNNNGSNSSGSDSGVSDASGSVGTPIPTKSKLPTAAGTPGGPNPVATLGPPHLMVGSPYEGDSVGY